MVPNALEVDHKIVLLKPILARLHEDSSQLPESLSDQLSRQRLNGCDIHPARGLGHQRIPVALEGYLKLSSHNSVRVILKGTGQVLTTGQDQWLDRFHNRNLIEAHIFGGAAGKLGLDRRAA